MGQFREFVVRECDLWDAMVHGVKKGYNAFKDKRKEQTKKSEKKKISEKMLNAKNKDDIKDLVKSILDNGYTISNGRIKEVPDAQQANRWLTEWRMDRKRCFSTGSEINSPSISRV